MSLCEECKNSILKARPGVGVCINICKDCSINDVREFLEKEQALQELSHLIKMNYPDPLKIEEYDSSDEGLMKRFRHLLFRLEYLIMNKGDDLEEGLKVVNHRNQLIDMVRSLFWWKEGESSMENAPRDGTDILIESSKGFDIVYWSGEDDDYKNQWIDTYGKVLRAIPERWWFLPEPLHKRHYCKDRWFVCETMYLDGKPQDEFLLSESNFPDAEYSEYRPVQSVSYCPFCGEKA